MRSLWPGLDSRAVISTASAAGVGVSKRRRRGSSTWKMAVTRATTWVGTMGANAPVSKVFDFDDLPAALEYLERGEQVGKVVLRHPG